MIRVAVCFSCSSLECASLTHYILARCEEQINRHDPSSEFYWETTDKKKAAERNAAMEKRAAAFKKAAAEKQADDQYNDDPIAKESLERWKEAEGR